MSGPTSHQLLLSATALIVVVRVFYLVRRLWSFPLRNGPGFFLGVEVPPGFYDGPGVEWLKRYRAVVLAEHLTEALVLAAIFAMDRWNLLPGWAGGSAVLFTSTMLGFVAWTRHRLGGAPPVRSRVAVALETRRLGDYISWPAEALVAVMIAFSWLLLLTQGDTHVRWQTPVTLTYVALGLLPGKIVVVRNSFPLPPERTEEHHRWLEAHRRHGVRVMDAFGWFLVAILFGYGLQHGWPAAKAIVWLPWLLVGVAYALALFMTGVIFRGEDRLTAMGRDLRPPGSWSGPFRGIKWIQPPGYWVWFGVWFGGLVLLLAFFPH